MFSANDLLMVKAISDEGSLTAAAAALHTSQPALSRRLSQLETRIGKRLFHRLPRGMQSTTIGETLLQHAEQVQAVTQAARVQVDAQIRLDSPILRLGIAPYVSLAPLTRILNALESEHPNLHFVIHVGAPHELSQKLTDGFLDLVIGPLGPEQRILRQTKLFEDNSVLMVRRDHPIRGKQPSLKVLSKHRWILPGQDHPLRQRIDNLFLDADLPLPKVHIETEDIPLSFNLALRSDYIVTIPRDVALFTQRDQNIKVLSLELTGSHAAIGVTQLRSRRLMPEVQTLIDAMSRELSQVDV